MLTIERTVSVAQVTTARRRRLWIRRTPVQERARNVGDPCYCSGGESAKEVSRAGREGSKYYVERLEGFWLRCCLHMFVVSGRPG